VQHLLVLPFAEVVEYILPEESKSLLKRSVETVAAVNKYKFDVLDTQLAPFQTLENVEDIPNKRTSPDAIRRPKEKSECIVYHIKQNY
jgi:hypothetical protein